MKELQWLLAQRSLMIATLQTWCDINSGSYHLQGLEKISTILQTAFSVLDCEITILPLAPQQCINSEGQLQQIPLAPSLRLSKRPKAKHQILLCGHMDTVFQQHHPFQQCQWLDEDQILNGPGVADMKGGLLVMLYGLLAFERSDLKQELGWEVLINSDEELGSPSSRQFFKESAKNKQVALVFEPCLDEKGTLAGARKGNGRFTLVVHGKAAHAGRAFSQGISAIYALAAVVTKINQLNQQRPRVTINVGIIEGGRAINMVPDLAMCHLEIRTYCEEDALWAKKNIHQLIKDVSQAHGVDIDIHGDFTRQSKPLTEATESLLYFIKKIALSLGQEIAWQSCGGCCDGNNLQALGLPTVDTLGVRGGHIHTAEEFIIVDSLIERAQLLYVTLYELAKGNFCYEH